MNTRILKNRRKKPVANLDAAPVPPVKTELPRKQDFPVWSGSWGSPIRRIIE